MLTQTWKLTDKQHKWNCPAFCLNQRSTIKSLSAKNHCLADSAIPTGWVNCLPQIFKIEIENDFQLFQWSGSIVFKGVSSEIPPAPPPPRRPFRLQWEKGNQMKGNSVAAVQCSLLLCHWAPKRRIGQYQGALFSRSIFLGVLGLQSFLSAGSAVVTENSIVLPQLHCFWVRTTLNSEIKVLTAFRSPLLHTIAGNVNQISGEELCYLNI